MIRMESKLRRKWWARGCARELKMNVPGSLSKRRASAGLTPSLVFKELAMAQKNQL